MDTAMIESNYVPGFKATETFTPGPLLVLAQFLQQPVAVRNHDNVVIIQPDAKIPDLVALCSTHLDLDLGVKKSGTTTELLAPLKVVYDASQIRVIPTERPAAGSRGTDGVALAAELSYGAISNQTIMLPGTDGSRITESLEQIRQNVPTYAPIHPDFVVVFPNSKPVDNPLIDLSSQLDLGVGNRVSHTVQLADWLYKLERFNQADLVSPKKYQDVSNRVAKDLEGLGQALDTDQARIEKNMAIFSNAIDGLVNQSGEGAEKVIEALAMFVPGVRLSDAGLVKALKRAVIEMKAVVTRETAASVPQWLVSDHLPEQVDRKIGDLTAAPSGPRSIRPLPLSMVDLKRPDIMRLGR